MRTFTVILILISLVGCKTNKHLLSDKELLNILDTKVWRVPLPSDKSKQWGIKVIDTEPHDIRYGSFDIKSKNESLISLRKINHSEFEFTLNQNNGTSRGTLKIQDKYQAITFFDTPRHYKDNLYAIGEIGTWNGYKTTPSQLIVLRLIDK